MTFAPVRWDGCRRTTKPGKASQVQESEKRQVRFGVGGCAEKAESEAVDLDGTCVCCGERIMRTRMSRTSSH